MSADEPAVALERARTLYALGRRTEARAACARLVADDPGSVGSWILLAQCCFDLGEHDAALQAADQALAAGPHDAVALRLRALVLVELADRRGRGREAAETAADAAVRADPGHWFGHVLVSRAALPEWDTERDHALGYRAAVRARELAPLAPTAHVAVGRAAEARGSQGEAESCYRAALAIDPENRSARNNLGRVLLKRGELKQAAASFAAVASTDHAHAGTGIGVGAHNLRAVVARLLVRAGLVSVVVFAVAFVTTASAPAPAWPARIVALLGAVLGWCGWAVWARRQVPRGLVRPLARLSLRTAHLYAGLVGVSVWTLAGLLLLCVPALDPAPSSLVLGAALVQVAASQAARVLARRQRRAAR